MNENRELQHIKSSHELKEVLRNKDEFEDSIKRIKNGVFYTPAPLVKLAHQYIEKEFGKNWKSEYSVYDPAWGTGNLTRDYIFDDLYCSTLEGEDLKLATNLNKGSRKFQMDFLNDDLPEFMVEAFKDKSKKWIVFMNPPYKNGPSGINHNNGVGFNVSKTNNKLDMKKDGVNGNDLYVQFIYKAIKLRAKYGADLAICVFSKATYLSGAEGRGLRKYLRNNDIEFKCGFLVPGKIFKGLNAKWSVSFTILK